MSTIGKNLFLLLCHTQMIFWRGTVISSFLIECVCVESVFSYYGEAFSKRIPSLKVLFPITQRAFKQEHFTHRRGLVFKSKIIVFSRNMFPKDLTITRYDIPIVSEYDNIDLFPNRLAIQTDNVDLIRELIARGHKVSWLLPDILKNLSYIVTLPVEHLFLDAYIPGHAATITGECWPTNLAKDAVAKEGYINDYLRPKFADEIGYYPADILKRLNRQNYFFYRRKKHLEDNKTGGHFTFENMLSPSLLMCYYTILTITYMLCKTSTVTTAPKRTANNE